MIKVVVGGGDQIQARHHCKIEEHFTPNFTPIWFANDMLQTSPYDDAQDTRAFFMNFNNRFVDGQPKK